MRIAIINKYQHLKVVQRIIVRYLVPQPLSKLGCLHQALAGQLPLLLVHLTLLMDNLEVVLFNFNNYTRLDRYKTQNTVEPDRIRLVQRI
jgi:hypothetical protein